MLNSHSGRDLALLLLAQPHSSLQLAVTRMRSDGVQFRRDSQKCGVCHSIAGQGNKNNPLDGVGSKLSVEDTRLWIVNAPEMMKKTNST